MWVHWIYRWCCWYSFIYCSLVLDCCSSENRNINRETEREWEMWSERKYEKKGKVLKGKKRSLSYHIFSIAQNEQNENLNLNENKHLYYISFYGHCTCRIKFSVHDATTYFNRLLPWHKKKVNNRLVSTSSSSYTFCTCIYASGISLYSIHRSLFG